MCYVKDFYTVKASLDRYTVIFKIPLLDDTVRKSKKAKLLKNFKSKHIILNHIM